MSVSLSELFESKAHIGHLARYWNPEMSPFIFGKRNGMHQINLDETKIKLQRAMHFLKEIASRKSSKVLFVGTKRIAQSIIKEEAMRCGMPYVDQYWRGGTLTNYSETSSSVKKLKNMEARQQEDSFGIGMTKKEIQNFRRELSHLEKGVGGIKDMVGLPDVLFVIDIGVEKIAITEALKLKIPIVGIVDTNYSPKDIKYPIPGNDDARKAIRLYTKLAADAILEGRQSIPDVAEEPAPAVIIKHVKKDGIAVSKANKPSLEKSKT
jgi:small subunit ribosomal protein S2